MEFDIEKVESLDYDTISNQLQYIFKSEQDIVNFTNFLKNIQKFVSLSDDKRHCIMVDLAYFKSQMQIFEKKIQNLLLKKKNEQTKMAIKKAKSCGEKVTENTVTFYSEDQDVIEGLEELYALVNGWTNYMNDIYYMCGQSLKSIGGYR